MSMDYPVGAFGVSLFIVTVGEVLWIFGPPALLPMKLIVELMVVILFHIVIGIIHP